MTLFKEQLLFIDLAQRWLGGVPECAPSSSWGSLSD
jgi:hypothetical protein